MKKKYNISTVKIKAWTNTDDLENANGFDVDTKIAGEVNVLLNALGAAVAQVIVDNMTDIDAALARFNKGVKLCMLEELNK